MKLAIIGSRGITDFDISPYIPDEVTEIISGGANGIDKLAEEYADKKRLTKHIIRPKYSKYSAKSAPIIRNKIIVEMSDFVLAFWDGNSKGTKNTIDYADKIGKKTLVVEIQK